jgi:Outer membrane protein beta-barrel domain
MRRSVIVMLAGIVCLAAASFASAADYDRYQRYDRGEGYSAPPRRGAPMPPPTHAAYGQMYFFGHAGLFEPNDSRNGLDGYDTGGNFDVGIGSRVSPVLAIEGAVGAFAASRGPDDVTVVPVTVGFRLIVPHPFVEPYLGAGAGLYFADLREDPKAASRGFAPFSGIDDTDTTFGGYASAGVDMWLNPRTALNFEGKYHWAEPTFTTNAGNNVDVKVGGWTINLGIRLAF